MNRPRLRFSLLTLLLLGTIVAMVVTLWRNGKDLVPLRAELMDLRTELGYFRVDQEDRIAIQESEVVTGKGWRWRLHLPGTKDYSLLCRTGSWGDIDLNNKQAWLGSTKGETQSFPLPNGQFTLNVSLEEYDGGWFFRYAYHNKLQGSSALKVGDDWLRDLLVHERFTEASTEELRSFDSLEPLVLLHLRKSITTKDENGKLIAERVVGPAESVLIWIVDR